MSFTALPAHRPVRSRRQRDLALIRTTLGAVTIVTTLLLAAPATVGAAALRDATLTSTVARAPRAGGSTIVARGTVDADALAALRRVLDGPPAVVTAEKKSGMSRRLVAVAVGAVVLAVLLVAGLAYRSRRRRWAGRAGRP